MHVLYCSNENNVEKFRSINIHSNDVLLLILASSVISHPHGTQRVKNLYNFIFLLSKKFDPCRVLFVSSSFPKTFRVSFVSWNVNWNNETVNWNFLQRTRNLVFLSQVFPEISIRVHTECADAVYCRGDGRVIRGTKETAVSSLIRDIYQCIERERKREAFL